MTPPEGLTVRLIAAERGRAGDDLPLTIELRNIGSTPIELGLRGRTITFDVTATTGDGRLVWRRLGGIVTQAILQLRVLQPGEVLALRDRWDLRNNDGDAVPPGLYILTGFVLTDEAEPLTTPAVTLRVGVR